jgi:hypothetical protein
VELLGASSTAGEADEKLPTSNVRPQVLYTDAHAAYRGEGQVEEADGHEENSFCIDLGLVPDCEARWWAAVLASETAGWTAAFEQSSCTYWSPWSYLMSGGRRFTLYRSTEIREGTVAATSPSLHGSSERPFYEVAATSPSFATALAYPAALCERMNIGAGQGCAALAAVQFWPGMLHRTVVLPSPKVPSSRVDGSPGNQRMQPHSASIQPFSFATDDIGGTRAFALLHDCWLRSVAGSGARKQAI